ncbi:MAG: TonB-dependent receptor [Halieaceae bacterium]|jgi:TonB-dependent receptor|nr:TonB-dependent receptor [Halieaceae bacterium]
MQNKAMYEVKASMQKARLATAVSAALSLIGAPAVAQESSGILEEVVVTGIRGSMQAALDQKRNSSGVMDAISAEDIGKFPDTNLAESLQRITGVSINRVNGEGSEVTIRGFGGDFNMVTLNGRQMPAADAQPVFFGISANTSSGDSRSFDFSNLASEGVAGLQVYKTGRAGVPSGGLGGTVNIQTIRPLEAGNRFSVGAKGMQDGGASSTVTPELSVLGSWANDQGTFGVSGFASYQDREFSSRTALQGGIVWQFPFDPSVPAFAGADIVNPPGPDDLTGFPNSATLVYSENRRERTNGALTMQFAPSDRFTVTADGLFARNDQSQKTVSDLPFFVRQFDFVAFDGDPVVSLPDFISEPLVAGAGSDFSQAGKELPFRNSLFELRDELYTFGLNVDFQINDSLTLNVDAAHGRATAGGNHANGALSEGVSLGGQAVAAQFVDFRQPIPNAIQAIADGAPATATMVGGQMVSFPGGNANGVFEKSDLGSQWALRDFDDQETTVNQFQMKLAFDNGGPVRANFGLGYIENELELVAEDYRDELGGWNTGNIGDIVTLLGEDAIDTVCILCEFNDHDNYILSTQQLVSQFTAAGGTIADGASLRRVGQEAYFVDPFAMGRAFDGFVNGGGTQFNNANRTLTNRVDNTIMEDVFSVYGEVILDGEVADRPLQIVAGLRWETTDVESASVQSIPLAKRWTSDNDFVNVFSPGVQTVTQDFDYNNLLPNLDVSLDVTENLKARASFSRTIARPQYSNMFVATNAGNPNTATFLGGIAEGGRGNAQLEPLESDNFDLSLEYYYGQGSAFTVAYFEKSVSNFIGNEQITTNLFGLRDVASGAPGTRSGQAVAELQARGFAATETNLFTMTAILDNPGAFPGGADEFIDPSQPGGAEQSSTIASVYDIDPDSNDPELQFLVQQPTNQASANIDGWEVNWVHFFTNDWLRGFGFQANATVVNGDIGYDLTADPNTEDQFALTGLSDSANIQGFYENDKIAVRVLYNWRDRFLANTNIGNRVPRFVDEYAQLDISASYFVTDSLTITFEGINMLEEPVVWRGRTDQQVSSYLEGDRRLLLGMRYIFQ